MSQVLEVSLVCVVVVDVGGCGRAGNGLVMKVWEGFVLKTVSVWRYCAK